MFLRHGYRGVARLFAQSERPTLSLMSVEDKIAYETKGYVHIRNVFKESEMDSISSWVDEVSKWDASKDKWLHHYEKSSQNEIFLTRTENFVSYHPGLSRLLMTGRVPQFVSDAMGEEVFLFKEKINYKYPGGAGYSAHQDAPAYKQISKHATCLISIDDSTMQNGCLEFVARRHKEGLVGLTEGGTISAQHESEMTFEPLETKRGDIVIFSSYCPHRSTSNLSDSARKIIYLTYNAQKEGYLRDEYYRHKRETMSNGDISLIKHFQGVDVGSKDNNPSNDTKNEAAYAESAGKGNEALTSIRELFAEFGDTWYDSVVTQAEHALQSARLAELNGATDEMIVASFLHDVGHLLLDEHGGNEDFLAEDKSHEAVGADYLFEAFPEAVVAPIRWHIRAKRYLCSTDDVYWAGLSDSSKRSFEVQGGKFTEREAEEFISQPYAKDAVQLRRWDDQAKKANIVTPDLEHYLSGVVTKVLLKN